MSSAISTDAHIQAWLTAPEDRRAASHAALMGGGAEQAQRDEPRYTLAELSAKVRKSPSRLHRLDIQQQCGERLAGRFMYRASRVLEYLASDKCQEHIRKLHAERQAKAMTKESGPR